MLNNKILWLMGALSLLLLIPGMPSEAKSNDILPNPNKVYSDQCYVWLKEMPQFFRERHYLSGGLAWDRHSYQGIYVSDDPNSLFYSRHYVGQTVLLFKPDTPGGDMNRGNIHCQYWCIQSGRPEGNQIWWWGESFLPKQPQLTLKVATGPFEGLSGIGTWHPTWPKDWDKPDLPAGYHAMMAHEYTLEMPVK